MKHPLTEQQCELLSRQPWLDPDVDVESTIHDMRAAADWQLRRCIWWLHQHLPEERDFLIKDFRTAMRPQEES